MTTRAWTSEGDGSGFPDLAAAMLSNGDTLVVASAAPTPNTAIAGEFRSPCELNSAFGQGGATELAFRRGVSIDVVQPTADGGALVAGSTNQTANHPHWLVAKLTADGHLDHAFGRQGWSLFPWGYNVTDVAVTRDGNIVVAGSGTENGSSFVSELTGRGRLIPTFGIAGRAQMPPWHDGGVQTVQIEPNDDILALVGGGNMGCWGVTAVTLGPTGLPEPGFTDRFTRVMRQVDPGQCFSPIFTGDITAGPHGFSLVGTGQRDCVSNSCTEHPQGRPDPSQRVIDIAFDYNGDLDTSFAANGVATHAGPMAVQAWALPQADSSLVIADSPATSLRNQNGRAVLLVYRLTSTGQLDNTYADHGVATIQLPYRNDYATVGISLPVSNGQQTAVASTGPAGNTVILIPVP